MTALISARRTTLGADAVEAFLGIYDDRPTTKKQLKVVLEMMLTYTVQLKWMTDNPAGDIKVKAPTAKVAIWKAEDVALWPSPMSGRPACL